MLKTRFNKTANPNNLYIMGLDVSINDDSLREKFSMYGTVVSCKVMVDPQGRSKGVGFVCFDKHEEAEAAVAASCGDPIVAQFAHQKSDAQVVRAKLVKAQAKQGEAVIPRYGAIPKERVVRPSPYSKPAKQSSDDNVYVCGLPANWNDESLHEFYSNFGAIVSVKVMVDQQGLSKGCGFARFASSSQAREAITQTHGCVLAEGAPPLQVRLANDKSAAAVGASLMTQYVSYNLGVIPPTLPSGYPVPPVFNSQGNIIIPPPFPILQPALGASLPHQVFVSLRPTLGAPLPTARQPLSWAPGEHDNPEASLFVLHIPSFFSEDDLRPIFEEIGPVSSVRVMRDGTNSQGNRGFAFVNMVHKEHAEQCVTDLSGRRVFNKVLQVSLKPQKREMLPLENLR